MLGIKTRRVPIGNDTAEKSAVPLSVSLPDNLMNAKSKCKTLKEMLSQCKIKWIGLNGNEYEFKRVDDTSALLNFKCGIEPIDKFIEDKKNGLDKFIKLHLSNLWIVFEDNEAVALFALSKDAIVLNSEDRHNIENDNQDVSSFVSPDDEENSGKRKISGY